MKKRALVTGTSEGIGKAFAERLAAEGYAVTGVARNEAKLKEAMGALGPEHQYVVADLSTEQGQEKVAALIKSGGFDLLVNNAGVGTAGTFIGVSLDKQLAMLRLNIEALTRLSHVFLSQAKSGDALINVSSMLAFLPMPSLGLYSATKAFVTSLSESLWFESRSKGVFVMGFCPGITSTSFHVNAGGASNDVPQNMAQTPEQVVDIAYKALRSRSRPTVISGYKNSMMAGLSRLMSRRSTVSMMGKVNS